MCITREAEATFGRLLAQYKAVLVTGPCQVGKSTMIGLCQGETCGYVMLNDPIALFRATRDPVLFFQDHPLSLVIDEVQYAPELYRFLVAMAARTGQLLNMSDIANDADVDAKTVSRWLSLLEASGIVLRLQPYFPYASKRVSRTPKLHFMDTGLVAHLRGGVYHPGRPGARCHGRRPVRVLRGGRDRPLAHERRPRRGRPPLLSRHEKTRD